MPRYDIPVWEMCEEAAKELPDVFSAADVIRKVREKRPEVKKNTIQAHVIALAPNHPSSKHYGGRHKVFHYLGRGRYRRYDESGSPEEPLEEMTEAIEEEVEAPGFSFEFEADLEGHLVNSLGDLEEGLSLYESPDGRSGQQFTTEVGRFDILAVDKNGDFVVTELKVGQASDDACAQILRYMGWVKRHLARERKVRGIIVCRNATDRLKYATSTVGSVGIKEYEVNFNFYDADLEVEED